jgi:predicted DNA-binding transcriptional regulator AlpA
MDFPSSQALDVPGPADGFEAAVDLLSLAKVIPISSTGIARAVGEASNFVRSCENPAAVSKRARAHARQRQDALPYPPRLMQDWEAARYLRMSVTKFRGLVNDGRMPKPVCVDGMVRWDLNDLDAAVDDLKTERVNTFDLILGRGRKR